ncbi:T9SS type A sorting domain-containing protein [Neolewinella lacunae]|uniref:T9SS type A sorting domain-containing protein n=1 Tax=Neolewinella lacunae TaxID=1517758 RepID=A0A923T7J8_9BACT|nr:T9SS type A sorting domain-containing protein [Neolewinella lacunae]MBC6993654.1 T9SS type A sorting domain-containing protein [Neolewinella lacunae]MDN3634718.1 T9SS type A sorting domain-containing protein [Neolewinella lacunae]
MKLLSVARGACLALLILTLAPALSAQTEHSVARQWNEQMLEAITNDFARPVVHARNLYHISAAMYDAWSLATEKGRPCLMASTQAGYRLGIDHWKIPAYADPDTAAEEAISYAAYRMILHRYQRAPGYAGIVSRAEQLMQDLGYDPAYTGTDYQGGGPADLGNYIAQSIIAFGMQDGSNEVANHANRTYPAPFNSPLQFTNPFSIFAVLDPNRWQTLQFPGTIIDQSGQVIGNVLLPFLGAEWGDVTPFALKAEDRKTPVPGVHYGNSPIYHDPGPPPYFSRTDTQQLAYYRWGFELVLKWSSHLDPRDGVMWDISPGALGNFTGTYPTDYADYPDFYNVRDGGTYNATGHPVNPVTGQPYPPNIVPRGDYTRVLAEFWADGPASETPPGHWFSIFNTVLDHPLFERRIGGEGPELPALEYDVKAYLTLGGAMHDAAITAWSIKGAYDYARPITAIRYMAVNGQSSNPNGSNYSIFGLRFDPGLIEPITDFSELENNTTLALVKARGWIGPDAIANPETDVAGVGWINPTMWMPYQRPNFVTPNFAGYISGHSTFSSTAATVLEKLTGSPYFPGGVGEFVASKNSFLVFEEGPSVDVVLQWATYRDASDQTSLSRIWGGIHPPADDVPGRIIGMEVGEDAYDRATAIFAEDLTATQSPAQVENLRAYPNPARRGMAVTLAFSDENFRRQVRVYDVNGRVLQTLPAPGRTVGIPTDVLPGGLYFVRTLDGRAGGVFQVF